MMVLCECGHKIVRMSKRGYEHLGSAYGQIGLITLHHTDKKCPHCDCSIPNPHQKKEKEVKK
jgi:hypothetical protein